MSEASLSVDGTQHLGWQELTVTRSMEQLTHNFDLGFVEQWTEESEAVPILEGDRCELRLDNKITTIGYVDDASIDYSATDHNMRVAGRSITCDLVDCSAIYKTGHWRNQSLLTIANNLCEPFGITVRVGAGVSMGENFAWFALHDGESVFDALERGCRQRGLIMMTTPGGVLEFTKVASKRTSTTIEYGVNVMAGGRSGSWKDRYSEYIVKGQSPGDDDASGHAIAAPKATSLDEVVTRYRPLIVQAETTAQGTGFQNRANWERNVRAGRSQRLRYTLDGWNNAEGLWAPNTLVRVVDKRLQVDTELLVVSVRQSKNTSSGSNTDLELADAKAMSVGPLTTQPRGKRRKNYYMVGSK